MAIRPVSMEEKARIKENCERGRVGCHECMCPYKDGMRCMLLETEKSHRPYDDKWTGDDLYEDDDGRLYIRKDVRAHEQFPTKEECDKERKARYKNFAENYP
jgi:hypothetical protein